MMNTACVESQNKIHTLWSVTLLHVAVEYHELDAVRLLRCGTSKPAAQGP